MTISHLLVDGLLLTASWAFAATILYAWRIDYVTLKPLRPLLACGFIFIFAVGAARAADIASYLWPAAQTVEMVFKIIGAVFEWCALVLCLRSLRASVTGLQSVQQRQYHLGTLTASDRYTTLVRAAANVVWITDGSGIVKESIAATPEDPIGVAGHSWTETVCEEDRARVELQWDQHSLNPAHPTEIDYRARRRDGETRWYRLRIVPLLRPNQRAEMIGVSVDVQEHKLSEIALHDALARATDANKSKADFLAVISHELRTPLTAVIGYSELLADGIIGPMVPDQAVFVERIRSAGSHLVGLIDQILDYAAIEQAKIVIRPQVVNAVKLVQDVATLVAPLCRDRGLDFVLDTPPAVMMSTDPGRLRQVLVNLLTNASKFTAEGSIRLRVYDDGSAVSFAVTDTGIGIAPELHERVFEQFFQVKQGLTRAVGGAGLGLAITKRLVNALHGEITVTSAAGRGSTFTVTLPRDLPDTTVPR